MTDRIFTAMDYARREKFKSVRDRIFGYAKGLKFDTPPRDELSTGKPVYAEINNGQWIVRCECGGAEAVSPDEPIFYCLSCGNPRQAGKLRRVVFPKGVDAIEAEVLKRPVEKAKIPHEIESTVYGKPSGYPRVWLPGETKEDLVAQNKEAGING